MSTKLRIAAFNQWCKYMENTYPNFKERRNRKPKQQPDYAPAKFNG
jgi:hypothetical protein